MLTRQSNNPMPVYYRLQTTIKEKIERGYWKPGDMIPSERVFAEEHKVSIGTVKKAISNLVNEGFLFRIQGKGTFVTGTHIRKDKLRYYRYYTDFGEDVCNMNITLLGVEKMKPISSINRLLKLRSNSDLFKIGRIMKFDEGPCILSMSYLARRQFKGLDTLLFRNKMDKIALYSILEENYGVPTIYNQELIRGEKADAETARLLQVPVDTPLITIEMLSFTYKDKPYEYRLSHCITDNRKLFREY